MRMGQGVRTGLGHGGITCVLQTQFSSFIIVFIAAWQDLLVGGRTLYKKNSGVFLVTFFFCLHENENS